MHEVMLHFYMKTLKNAPYISAFMRYKTIYFLT